MILHHGGDLPIAYKRIESKDINYPWAYSAERNTYVQVVSAGRLGRLNEGRREMARVIEAVRTFRIYGLKLACHRGNDCVGSLFQYTSAGVTLSDNGESIPIWAAYPA